MPLPSPKPDEKQADYIARFMKNAEALKTFPDEKQRLAVAYEKFRDRNKKKAAVKSAAFAAAEDAMRKVKGPKPTMPALSPVAPTLISANAATAQASVDLSAAMDRAQDQLNAFGKSFKEIAAAAPAPELRRHYRLHRDSFERLKNLVQSGTFEDKPWSFTADDSNTLLKTPPNFTEYGKWFLGFEVGKPEHVAENGATDQQPDKTWYSYPFGNGETVNVNALREIVRQAMAAGETDISSAAAEAITIADSVKADTKIASGEACDLDITFSAPVTIKAAGGKSGPPTFNATVYNGDCAMELDGWSHPMVIDLTGIDFTNKNRPVLRDHDQTRPIGHTTTIGVQGGGIYAQGVISVSSKDADEVVKASANKFPWQISIGAKVKSNQFVPRGTTADANGKSWAGPLNIARRSVAREISFLSLGADDDTSAQIAAKAAGVPMSRFQSWATAAGLNHAEMNDDTKSHAMALFKAAFPDCDPEEEDESGCEGRAAKPNLQGVAKPSDVNAGGGQQRSNIGAENVAEMHQTVRAAALAERVRLRDIEGLLDEYRPKVDAVKFRDIEAKAISGEWDRNRTELELIRIVRGPDIQAAAAGFNSPMINTGAGSEASGNIIAAACARSNGVNEKMAYKGLNEREANIAASINGLTMHRIIAMSAARLGMHVSPGSIDDGFLGDFIRRDKASHREQLQARRSQGMDILASSGAGFSTMSLTGITENILYKAMLESYLLQPSVVSDIAYERDTNDFKPFKVYRLTASGDFSVVPPSGEVKSFGLQDESYANQVITKAALLVLKREDIINDDMGALMQAPQVLGRKAALNREKTVFTTLLSGLTTAAPGPSTGKTANTFNFWSTNAANYQSGSNSALSLSSLQTAEQKFLQQTDANGDPIGIQPDRLLVPPELKVTARNLFEGASIVVGALGSTSAKSLDPNYNSMAGNFRPIVSPFLGGSSSVTGKSATQWMLLCNPAGGMATVQVGYLRGQRTPIIRQVETDAMMLGIAYQAIYDFGTALLDYRCGQYSAGA